VSERFSNRWAVIIASLGMAVGTGNIWRFPRIAAKYGGGTFIVAWLIFLFTWSIPLLLMEFALGKDARKAPAGAFGAVLGKKYTWMGGFVALCTTLIMAYYSVMSGWCLRYTVGSMFQSPSIMADPRGFWELFADSGWPLLFHAVSLVFCGWVVSRGILHGVERLNKIFVPGLFILLALLALRSVTLPGSVQGIAFLGHIDPGRFLDHRVWLEALSQSAWSTGAGWGLILVYAIYLREREDITLTTILTGLGNNSASLLAALAIIPAIFALVPPAQVDGMLAEGNVGLTFIVLPRIFEVMPFGALFMMLFFIALTLAAYSSLTAMIQLGVSSLSDLGYSRRTAVIAVVGFGFLFGLPSSLSLQIFDNQDWVWGLGLILSGGFFIFLLLKRGVAFIHSLMDRHPGNDIHIKKGIWKLWAILLPAQWFLLIGWWFYLSITEFERETWWNPLRPFSLGTCLLQWSVVLAVLGLLNRTLARRLRDL